MARGGRRDAGDPGPAGRRAVGVAWLALGGVLLALAAWDLQVPGPNYDEVIQARPARDFLEGEPRGLPVPGSRSVSLAGRPLPWRIQTYMGGLKSQLLIPSFALLGAELEVLRLTTVAWSVIGLGLAMAWARRTLGAAVAIVAGALLALDPSFLFISRHDWGSFALGFLCRMGGLLALTVGWRARRSAWMALGGLALGLGLYNKVDSVLFLAAAALGLLVAAPGVVRDAWRARRPLVGWAVAGGLLGAAPVAASALEILASSRVVGSPGSLAEKGLALRATLDGSYFLRLLEVGGRFERMPEAGGAPGSLLLAALLLALPVGAWLAGQRTAPPALRAARRFVLVTTLALGALLLALPGAIRAHHMMNAYPLPHWLVAIVLVGGWNARRARPLLRAGVVLALLAVPASQLYVTRETRTLLARSGGRGWWSGALGELARQADDGASVVVSLDWGIQEPVLFLTDRTRAVEATWPVRRALRARRPWTFRGGTQHLYVLHEAELDYFGLGPAFLEAVRALEPGFATERSYRDREGRVVLVAVRFAAPHRLVYDGRWRITPAHR